MISLEVPRLPFRKEKGDVMTNFSTNLIILFTKDRYDLRTLDK
jgi:hypothetical protein